MKLLNHTLSYFAAILLPVLAIWAGLFYFEMLEEVYDSLDDGLDNYKTIIIRKAHDDSLVLYKNSFAESNYSITQLGESQAVLARDLYKDTMMYMENELDFEPVRMLTTVFTLDGRFYELKVISSMVEEDDLIEDLLYALLWLYAALILSVLLVNNFLLKRVWKPFYALLEEVKKFRLGRETAFSGVDTRVKEFRELNETIASFIRENQEVYNNQKQFIENASHELQTPVAISLNKLELLAEQPVLDEKSLEIVGNVMQNLERLARLNKSLLLLSKIENRQFENDGPVDLQAIFTKSIADFDDFIEFKEIKVIFSPGAVLQPVMNRDLAEILVSNLLKNAIVHNVQGGSIEIIFDPFSFSVKNTGATEPLDGKRIFNRFYKESPQKNTTGLGLPIVKAIGALYGFSVTYSYDGMHGLTVRLYGFKR